MTEAGSIMKEIGGYFELERFSGREYHEDLLGVNNGRNALLYLLKARKIKRLYIPRFLCDSVSNLCTAYGFEFRYYAIGKDFLPVFSEKLNPGEYLYVVNFYGQISNETVLQLKQTYGNIIFDNIHAFYQRSVPGVDTIYSCRKFFGVPDGGYLATDAVLEETLERDTSAQRMKHILGRFEGCASDYYGDFKANDGSFAKLPLRKMSELTKNLLRAIDYEAARKKRNENYARLADGLGGRNQLKLRTPDGPYAYPFYCERGMELKRKLAAEKIYVATLWPNVLEFEGTLEKDYAENILPLPCDQRYTAEDMTRVIDAIERLV